MLRTFHDFEIVGEVSSGYELVELPVSISADIALVDLNLPAKNNLDPAKLVHQWNPSLRLLVIADNLSPQTAIRMLRNGALGYIVRMEDFDHLVMALHSVDNNHRYVSSLVTDQILDAVVAGKSFESNVDERISSREREILQLLVEGRTNAEIGRQLVISTRTVETHRTNLMRKLGLSSQFEMIRYAIKNGLLSID